MFKLLIVSVEETLMSSSNAFVAAGQEAGSVTDAATPTTNDFEAGSADTTTTAAAARKRVNKGQPKRPPKSKGLFYIHTFFLIL